MDVTASPQFNRSNALNEATGPKRPEAFEQTALSRNLASFTESSRYSKVRIDDLHSTWAQLYPAVHGTTIERALGIIKDQRIASYATLAIEKPEVIANNITVNTDQLDVKLGLDKYVFLNLGRVHPFSVHPVYFVFPNSITKTAGAIASLREIVHFGALVSKEAEDFAKKANPKLTDNKIKNINRQAEVEFFKNSYRGADFISEVFPRFIQREFPQIQHYTSSLMFPNAEVKTTQVGQEVVVHGCWEGPQIMVPKEIDFAHQQPAILITNRSSSIKDQFIDIGYDEAKIFSMQEVVTFYRKSLKLGDYLNPLDQYLYLNTALRDLALMSAHNDFGESFPESMNGFKDRL
jgi:hypothetical protein